MNEIFERFGVTGGGPGRLGDALKAFLKQSGLSRRMRWRDIEAVWREVVGEEMGSRTRVVRVARGVLQVEVDSAPLMQELGGFYKHAILKEIQARVKKRLIGDLVFKLGDFS